MTKNLIIPTRGLVVKSSYNPHSKIGYYKVFDIHNNHCVLKRFFKNVSTSNNVMAFLGIAVALKYSNKFPIPIKVHCSNDVAVRWAKMKACNSKIKDREISNFIIQATEYFRCNDFATQIQFGIPRFLKPITTNPENNKAINTR